jgi:methionyl aminopeptidase
MREIGKLTSQCLDELKFFIKPGISTGNIDQFVKNFGEDNDLKNAQYGYRFDREMPPFPGYCCTSINEVLCHGIPAEGELLNDGDIVSVDITFKSKDGYHGDACRTYIVGQIPQKTRDLVEVAECALQIGIQQCFPEGKIGDIGKYIEEYIAHNKMYVAKDFVGHGIGQNFHENPSIPHVLTEGYNAEVRMHPGDCFTVEPIILLHHTKQKVLHDGWTVLGKSLAAQFEATIGINETGYEVFAR